MRRPSDRASRLISAPNNSRTHWKGRPLSRAVGLDGRAAPVDEIKQYIGTLYPSPYESHWRLAELWTHSNTLSVKTLKVHLENQQIVMLRPDTALGDQTSRGTTLTTFIEENQRMPNQVLY
ncbi:hypothetical protein EV356DRAFT_517631 [Viridothelium virens]|uniref:Uncharacterized protein n=1 Tax=Viridothelium virens TaxID=1048519 RepID=A0A6A6H232_VIRVR|nr:hypothetical protein EV356DRAFT_517631 [Viridothelium virens]